MRDFLAQGLAVELLTVHFCGSATVGGNWVFEGEEMGIEEVVEVISSTYPVRTISIIADCAGAGGAYKRLKEHLENETLIIDERIKSLKFTFACDSG